MFGLKRALLTATLLLVFTAAGLCAAPANPSAADGTAWSAGHWTEYDWNASSGKSGSARFATGEGGQRGTLQISTQSPNDARFVRELAVEPDTVYHFACRVRTEQVGDAARGAGISVLGVLEGSGAITGTSDGWQSVDFYGKTAADQRKLSVTIGIGGYGSLNSGTAWFREVVVNKVSTVPPGVTVAALQPLAAPAAVSAAATQSHAGAIAIAGFACFGMLLLALGLFARRRSAAGQTAPAHPAAALLADGLSKNVAEISPESGTLPAGSVETGMQTGRAGAGRAGTGNDRVNIAVVVTLTAVCLVVSLFNLGSHQAPETGWQSAAPGASVTLELGRETDISRIYYYSGIDDRAGDPGRFTLSAREPGGSFVAVGSFAKDNAGVWKFVEVAVRTSAVRLSADLPGGRINEIALVEKGQTTPVTGLRIGAKSVSAADLGKAENLIDEQASFPYAPSFRTGFYFDEIYHARSAWEMLNRVEPYETTHPPLGKLLIASGIALFGMNPFGWRVVGTLFGVALVPLMYFFGLKLFRDRFYAFCAAFLMLVDFMRFAQSRVAVIDVYGVFFILVLYYVLLDLFPAEGEPAPRSSNATLFLAGAAFGIGAACKWIALYAGGGMLVLVAFKTLAELKRRNFPPTQGAAGFLLRRIAVCFAAFGVIPATIYLLAYLPFLALPGPGHGLADVLRLQQHMLNYHRMLHAVHPFSSAWWSWPLDLHPVWMYTGAGLPEGVASSIACFGNPAIFWLAIPALACAATLAIRRRDARMGVVLTALLFQYLPWVGINRLAFIYHFFSTLPFVILCLVATLKEGELVSSRARGVTCGYLALAAGLFILFYPVLSGLQVQQSYVAQLKWLPSWIF